MVNDVNVFLFLFCSLISFSFLGETFLSLWKAATIIQILLFFQWPKFNRLYCSTLNRQHMSNYVRHMIMYVFVQKHSSTHKNPPISGWPPKHNRGTIHNSQLYHQLTSCPKHCWWRRQQHEWGGRSAQHGPRTAAASACTHRPSCQEGAVTLACHFHTGCATGSPAHPSACGRTSLGTTQSGWQAPENRCSLLHTFLATKLSLLTLAKTSGLSAKLIVSFYIGFTFKNLKQNVCFKISKMIQNK